MQRLSSGAPLVILALALWPAPCLADTVYQRSGETLKGLIVEEHWDRIVVSTEAGEKTLLRSDVDEVFYDDPERNYLYLGNQALDGKEFAMARGFFRKALQIYPRFQEAEDALHRLDDLQQKEFLGFHVRDPVAALKERWGLALEEGSAPWLRVRSIEAGSLAERSGMAVGDALVSFWGDSLAYLPAADLAQALLGPSGSLVKLTLAREIHLAHHEKTASWPGATLGMSRLGLTVMTVQPHGDADQAGLASLDRIVAIEGKSTRYLPLVQAREQVNRSREQGIALAIHRDLQIRRE